jgi:hypothetical protein
VTKRANAPKTAEVTTTATITVTVRMSARSQNELNRILAAGASARLIPAGDGLYRVVGIHPSSVNIDMVEPV